MHREKPHKLLQVGVTPTPATILRLEPKQPRGFQAKDVLHRLGEGGLFTMLFQAMDGRPISQGGVPAAGL